MSRKKNKRDQWFEDNITDNEMKHLLHYSHKNKFYYQFMIDNFPKEFDKEFWMNILVVGAIV